MSHDPFTEQARHEAAQRALDTQHEQTRRQLWIGIAIAVAGAESAIGTEVPQRWADTALRAYDQRFPAPPQA